MTNRPEHDYSEYGEPHVTARSFCHHFAFILSLWRMPK